MIASFDFPYFCNGAWSLFDFSKERTKFHTFLLLNRSKKTNATTNSNPDNSSDETMTMILQSAEQLEEVTNKVQFSVEDATIHAETMLECGFNVQIFKRGVFLLNGGWGKKCFSHARCCCSKILDDTVLAAMTASIIVAVICCHFIVAIVVFLASLMSFEKKKMTATKIDEFLLQFEDNIIHSAVLEPFVFVQLNDRNIMMLKVVNGKFQIQQRLTQLGSDITAFCCFQEKEPGVMFPHKSMDPSRCDVTSTYFLLA